MKVLTVVDIAESNGASLYDVSERIRTLNEEMAKEPPIPEDGLTQSSVKFKDTLVDFISPTPEPESESEPGTSRTDLVDQSPRELESSEQDSTLSEDGSSTVMMDGTTVESDPPDQLLPTDDGVQNPRAPPSDFPSEATPTTSDQKTSSLEHDGSKSPETSSQADAESSPGNTNAPSPASDSETVKPVAETTYKTCSSPNIKATKKNRTSVRNSMSATKVVGSSGKPTGNARPKSTEAKKSSKTSKQAAVIPTPANKDTPVALDTEADKAEGETANKMNDSPKPTENHPSNRNPAARNTVLAAKVEGLFGKADGNPGPSSAEVKPIEGSANVGPNRTPGDSEHDDMALVECSGKFRMMSVAELTALQRRSAPDSGCWTSRSPATPWTHSPK